MAVERKTGRVIFTDCDGSLIMDRKLNDMMFTDILIRDVGIDGYLAYDARLRGVKVIKHDYKNGNTIINCTVDYLSRKVKR